MPRARPRRLLAALTALIVGATCLVLLTPPTAAGSPASLSPPGARAVGVQSGVQSGRRARARATTLARAAKRAARQAAAKKRAEARAERRRKAEARRKAAAWRTRLARVRPRNPATWITTVPEGSTPSSGPRFNNPYGKIQQRRVLIEKVITAINSSPGYRIPENPKTKAPMPAPRTRGTSRRGSRCRSTPSRTGASARP